MYWFQKSYRFWSRAPESGQNVCHTLKQLLIVNYFRISQKISLVSSKNNISNVKSIFKPGLQRSKRDVFWNLSLSWHLALRSRPSFYTITSDTHPLIENQPEVYQPEIITEIYQLNTRKQLYECWIWYVVGLRASLFEYQHRQGPTDRRIDLIIFGNLFSGKTSRQVRRGPSVDPLKQANILTI